MKKILPLILPLLFVAAAPAVDFYAGNRAYVAKQYDEAVRVYESLLRRDAVSAAGLYNLGGAYYAQGEIGKAVLAYRRAQLLEPTAADIAGNLAAIRKEHGLTGPATPLWQKPFLYFSLNWWTWLGFGVLTAMMLVVLLRGAWLNFLPPQKFPHAKARAAIIAGAAVLGLAAVGIFLQLRQFSGAVVTAGDAALHVSPFADAGEIAALREGEIVRPLKRHGDFVYVQNPAGQRGWIAAEKLTPLLPRS